MYSICFLMVFFVNFLQAAQEPLEQENQQLKELLDRILAHNEQQKDYIDKCQQIMFTQGKQISTSNLIHQSELKKEQNKSSRCISSQQRTIKLLQSQVYQHQEESEQTEQELNQLRLENIEQRILLKQKEQELLRLKRTEQELLRLKQTAEARYDYDQRKSAAYATQLKKMPQKDHGASSSSSSSLVSGQSTPVKQGVRSQAKKDNLQQAALHIDYDFMKSASKVTAPSQAPSDECWLDVDYEQPVSQSKKRLKP